MKAENDKQRILQLIADARAKKAAQAPKPKPVKRKLHSIGHPWDHIIGDECV